MSKALRKSSPRNTGASSAKGRRTKSSGGWDTFRDLVDLLPGRGKDRPGRPYGQVAAVYACVRAKADAISGAPLRISTTEDEVIESGPLVDLVRQPNQTQTRRAFWRATSAFLDLFGRAHWVKTAGMGGRPTEVLAVNPIQMMPILHGGEQIGWYYRPIGRLFGQVLPLMNEEVHTIIDPNWEEPFMYWEGMSPRQAAFLAIAQYYKADLANESSLDNDVAQPGALKTDKNLTADQKRDIRAQIEEKYAGVRNRRRLMLLEGGLSWESMAATFTEMEFSGLKGMSRTDICAAFQVPPPIVGYFDETRYQQGDTAETSFWVGTIGARAEWLAEEWDLATTKDFQSDASAGMSFCRRQKMGVSARKFRGYRRGRDRAMPMRGMGKEIFSWFDFSKVPAIMRAQLSVAQQAALWIDKGVPLNEIIEAFDLPFETVAWGDTWYKPIGLADVREDTGLPGADDPDGTAPAEPAEPQPGTPAEAGDPGEPPMPPPESGEPMKPGKAARPNEERATEQALIRIWQRWRASWAPLERLCRSKVNGHFMELRRQVLAKLAEAEKAAASRSRLVGPDAARDLIGRVLFDLVEANKRLLVRTTPIMRSALDLGGRQTMKESAEAQGKEEPDVFHLNDPLAVEAMRQRDTRVVGINRTLRRELADTLSQGLAAGETAEDLAGRVRATFNIASGRARTIGMTEVGGAVEEGRQIARRQANVPLKSWLWSRKETGRPWHGALEQETLQKPIAATALFVSAETGATTQQPRGFHVAKEDINCGCTALSRFEGDDVKSTMERYERTGFLTWEEYAARQQPRTPKEEASNEESSSHEE